MHTLRFSKLQRSTSLQALKGMLLVILITIQPGIAWGSALLVRAGCPSGMAPESCCAVPDASMEMDCCKAPLEGPQLSPNGMGGSCGCQVAEGDLLHLEPACLSANDGSSRENSLGGWVSCSQALSARSLCTQEWGSKSWSTPDPIPPGYLGCLLAPVGQQGSLCWKRIRGGVSRLLAFLCTSLR